MLFIKNMIATFFCGFAVSNFRSGNYEKAIHLFNKAKRFSDDTGQPEYYHSCLGRCYLAIKDFENAFMHLSKSYKFYHEAGVENLKKDFSTKEFDDMLHAYSTVLKVIGRTDESEKINKERLIRKTSTSEPGNRSPRS